MKNFYGAFHLSLLLLLIFCNLSVNAQGNSVVMFPENNSRNVNPDTHLELTFKTVPILGDSGQIKIYDASNDKLVDMLDLSIPPGPTKPTPSPDAIYTPVPYKYASGHFTNANTKPGTPSGEAKPTPDDFQLTIIGGFTDGFHFYPVIIHGNTATIYPHNNLLEYGKTYYVQIDPGVLSLNDDSFKGISSKDGWTFTTKANPPLSKTAKLMVSADGTGDFNTVQGAMDFIPDFNKNHVTVFIKNGDYEEIVYFRNKTNVSIIGEDREKVHVHYKNSEVFNPHPINIKTNEWPGTFPSRRAAFMVDNSKNINLINMTIETTAYGQAEGLLINGEEIIVSDVTIIGSGDALQSNGTVYYSNCLIDGLGDTILGRGATFFINSTLKSVGTYMWIRNTSANHGNVFVNCKFETKNERETELARAPTNHGTSYPYCEAVLINCQLSGISPVGWGPIGGETSNVHYWEYNSTNLNDGNPVDVSKRLPASRQLTMEKDAKIIQEYQNPSYVLGGWKPELAPIILEQPKSISLNAGSAAELNVKTAGVPKAKFQWFKNNKAIEGAVNSTYKIKNVKPEDAGIYSVSVMNSSGSISSKDAVIKIN